MSDRLRVLIISGEYPPMEGGVADFSRILARHLLDQQVDVQVLTSRAAQPPDDADTHDGIVVHATMSAWGWRSLHKALRAIQRNWQPDVINIQYQTAAYGMHPAINLLPRMLPDIPIVTTFHDLLTPYLFPKAGPVRWWVNLELARSSRSVIVTNAQDRLRIEQESRINQVTMIPIGSNVTTHLPPGYERGRWLAERGIPEGALVLGYFGFMNASKGGEELIEALHQLAQQGRDVYLLMIGGHTGASDPTNHDYMQRMQALIRRYQLDRRVVYTGYLDDQQVSAAFNGLDLCVLPYRDGVSFRRGSLMAALIHGCAIVTTQPQIPLPEIAHGQNLWLAAPDDAAALASGIACLADDHALRKQLREGALALASLFDWDVIAYRTADLLRSVRRSGQ